MPPYAPEQTSTEPLTSDEAVAVIKERYSDAIEALSDTTTEAECGALIDGKRCPDRRVPNANGCWTHYGPEDSQAVQDAHDALYEQVNGRKPRRHEAIDPTGMYTVPTDPAGA